MAKRNITPKRRGSRRKLLEMMQDAGINDVTGVQGLFKRRGGVEGSISYNRT